MGRRVEQSPNFGPHLLHDTSSLHWQYTECVARKKSGKKSAQDFVDACDELLAYVATARGLTAKEESWCLDYAIIRLYREFETLMLDFLTVAINNDTATVAATTGIRFPKHLTDEVCEFLVIGTGFFDFKGRDGLIKTLKSFLPKTHYVVVEVSESMYTIPLDKLSALRNFAAHDSHKSKSAALKATSQQRIGSAGSWLKTGTRFAEIVADLKVLAFNLENCAPF